MRTRAAASCTAGGDLRRRCSDHLQRKGDVFEHRHVRIERIALEHHRHVAVAGREERRVRTIQVHEPVRRGLQAGDDAERRRLARAGRTEQGEELPRAYLQVDVAQHARVAERLADARELHLAAVGDGASHLLVTPLTAPAESPATMCFCAAMPSAITGSIAISAAAASCAHCVCSVLM